MLPRKGPGAEVIVVVNVKITCQIDAPAAQPGAIVHARGVRLTGVTDDEFGVFETEIRTVPIVEVIQVVDLGSRLEAGRILTSLEVCLAQQAGRVSCIGETVCDRGPVVVGQIRTHMETTMSRGVLSRQDAAARRCTHGVHRIGTIEQNATLSQPV